MAIKGIDISNWQKGINIIPMGIDFMFCKATEGRNYTDKTCEGFITQAKNKGIPWGYYHFARENDAAAEAEFFYNATKGYTKQGIPVLDYEVWGRNSNDVAWCERFIQKFHDLTGIWCMIYISASHCKDFRNSWIPEKCSLWVAGYPRNYTDWPAADVPYNVAPWKTVTIWQFSSSLRLSGYSGNLDGDYGYIDRTGWNKIAGGGSATPTPTPSKPSTPSTSGGIAVDGLWGQATTKRLQQVLGTPADGIISNQSRGDFDRCNGGGLLTSTFKFGMGGSPCIKALQKKLGVTADGYIGVNTIKALQRRYGTGTDGRVDKPSPMVKALQKKLNQGTI